MTRVAILFMFASGILGASGAAASFGQSQSNDPQNVVVTGQRETPKTLRKKARDYVRTVGAAPGQLAAARWIDPLCVRVFGLSEELSRRATDRLLARAKAAGARTGPPGCKANFALIFTSDGADMARRLKGPVDGDGPKAIRWWYSVESRSRDGGSAKEARLRMASGDSAGKSTQSQAEGIDALPQSTLSLVSTMQKQALDTAVVIVDVTAAEGVNFDAVTDYASFVGLARLQPTAAPVRNSILALFGDESDRRELSDWDVTFLKTLYQMPLDRTAHRHRQRLIGGIVEVSTPDR